MKLLRTNFEKTDEFQWVRKVAKGHYIIVNGDELPNGNITFGYYDINLYDDDIESDKLDELINEYYSSCTDFFLAATDENRDEQMQLIAEMVAEQEWEIMPIATCTLEELELNKVNEKSALNYVLDRMESVSF